MKRLIFLVVLLPFLLIGQGFAADSLELRLVSETDTTITLGWTPKPGFGYLFSADGNVVSRTNDPNRSSVKFSKNYTKYEVAVITKGLVGIYPPPPPPPSAVACGDGIDNDGDLKIDYPNDPGCTSATDPDETDPTPPPNGETAPVRATTVDCKGGSYAATSVKNDTRYIDCNFTGDMNLAMNGKQRITIIGSQLPVTQLRGVTDIWIEGRPDAYMNSGPRTDGGDLLQIKRYPYTDSGALASNITLRWIRFHDNSRPAGSSAHPDGVQLMSGVNIRFLSIRMERVDVQGIFVNSSGSAAVGGGPISNILVADSYIEKPPTGYYTVIFGSEVISSGIRNTRVGSNVRLGTGCYPANCTATGMMDLNGNPIKGYIVG